MVDEESGLIINSAHRAMRDREREREWRPLFKNLHLLLRVPKNSWKGTVGDLFILQKRDKRPSSFVGMEKLQKKGKDSLVRNDVSWKQALVKGVPETHIPHSGEVHFDQGIPSEELLDLQKAECWSRLVFSVFKPWSPSFKKLDKMVDVSQKVLIDGELVVVRMVEFTGDPFLGCGVVISCSSMNFANMFSHLAASGDSDNDFWQDRASCWGEQNLMEDNNDEVTEVVANSLNKIVDWVGNVPSKSPNPISQERCLDEVPVGSIPLPIVEDLVTCRHVQNYLEEAIVEVDAVVNDSLIQAVDGIGTVFPISSEKCLEMVSLEVEGQFQEESPNEVRVVVGSIVKSVKPLELEGGGSGGLDVTGVVENEGEDSHCFSVFEANL
ncbi:unnamed protein product [Lupinus luteus]|uniref:DUF4283 domain-containing protein n=1 Tax=Lupinus luteus TaxID=3873 RepID=A0AAV1XX09_LUPLU